MSKNQLNLFTPASETTPAPMTDWPTVPTVNANPHSTIRAGDCVECGEWANDRCYGLCQSCWSGQRGND